MTVQVKAVSKHKRKKYALLVALVAAAGFAAVVVVLAVGGPMSSGSAQQSCKATEAGGYQLPDLTNYANSCNTGPRYACASTVNDVTTSIDGEVIERVCIVGSLRINHNNVVVRDVLIMGTGRYALDIGRDSASCPANVRVEYTEVDMAKSPGDNELPIYQRCAGGLVLDHIEVHNAGRGGQLAGNVTVTDSYFYAHRTVEGAHRTALSTHGGNNFTVTGNTLICVNTGCSSSVNLYSDHAPVTNYLLQNNIVAGGSICVRGGETHAHAAETHDIRVLDNKFSTRFYPECGSLRAFAQFDAGAQGNVRSGNVYMESGQPIPGE